MFKQQPTHAIDFRNGKKGIGAELNLQRPEGPSRASKSSKLILEPSLIQWTLTGWLHGRRTANNHRFTGGEAGFQQFELQGLTLHSTDFQMKASFLRRNLSPGLLVPVLRPLGITREPNRCTWPELRDRASTWSQPQTHPVSAEGFTGHNPTPDLLGWKQRIRRHHLQNQPLAIAQGFLSSDLQPSTRLNPKQTTNQGAAFLAPTAMDKTAVVHPLQPTSGQPP